MTEQLLNRFLTYVKYNTQSSESSTTVPSTALQLEFAKKLYAECNELGLTEVSLDKHGYVMATLPSNVPYEVPTIGFIAHMDTSPDNSGQDVKPNVQVYTSGDLLLNTTENIVLSPSDYPILNKLQGETLITTDGTTLLGADDKAGIAEIMTAISYLIAHPEVPHGTVRIGFTPDEEVGRGADYFDVDKFNAIFAYTVDGGELGELEAENFNAASAKVIINGRNIHPGYAKDKMKNSIHMAYAFEKMLPSQEVPEKTSGYEGFFHLNHIEGNVEQTILHYIIRDFDKDNFEARKNFLTKCQDKMNTLYGAHTVSLSIKDEYFNMKEMIDKEPAIMELAQKAMKNLSITPKIVPIRGGTDGARLSFMGLPCPNLFTGGYNFHSKHEFAVLGHMDFAMQTIIEIIKLHALSHA